MHRGRRRRRAHAAAQDLSGSRASPHRGRACRCRRTAPAARADARAESRWSARAPTSARQHRGLQQSLQIDDGIVAGAPQVAEHGPRAGTAREIPRVEGNAPVETVDELEQLDVRADRPASRCAPAGSGARSAAAAGMPWMTSPSEPSRTMRNAAAVTPRCAARRDARQQVARGVILRVADDRDAAAVGA